LRIYVGKELPHHGVSRGPMKKKNIDPQSIDAEVPLPQPLGVVLIDPLHVVRAALALLISAQPDMEVLAQAGTSDEGLKAVLSLPRRLGVVVLIGLNLGGERDAYWLMRSIRESVPSLPLLACGANIDATTISKALFFGADGFVDKSTDLDGFLGSLRRMGRGEMVLDGLPSNWLGTIADDIDRQLAATPSLTEREREVLAVAAQGLTARQIGSRLGVRERTITTHLGTIYRKLGASGRVAAISAATRSGLVSVPYAE